jgi:predicted nucleic acid-binding protein
VFRHGLSLSPDGRSLAFFTGGPADRFFGGHVGLGKTLMLRRLDEPEAVAIARLERGSGHLAFSPDGRWVAYANLAGVHKVFPIFDYGRAAAEWHAVERARLAAAGETPPFDDGQIAAIASVNHLVLVTTNKTGFRGFKGLRVQNWT